MRRALPFLVPFLILILVGVPLSYWLSRDGRPLFEDPIYVTTALVDVDPVEQPFIEVTGMSHYNVVVKQDVPGNFLREAKTLYLFPIYEAHDLQGRAVKLLVRTDRKPRRLVSYEFMRVRGKVGLATAHQVPFGTEELFGRKGYYFADEILVLEADAVFEAPVPALDVEKPLGFVEGG